LRYGAGVKGKTIEAMYYQIPLVTTDFGIEGLQDINSIIEAKNSEYDFAREVVELYLDELKLQEISVKYMNYIKQHFTKEIALRKIEMALESE